MQESEAIVKRRSGEGSDGTGFGVMGAPDGSLLSCLFVQSAWDHPYQNVGNIVVGLQAH
jgi:hypothetical protein